MSCHNLTVIIIVFYRLPLLNAVECFTNVMIDGEPKKINEGAGM